MLFTYFYFFFFFFFFFLLLLLLIPFLFLDEALHLALDLNKPKAGLKVLERLEEQDTKEPVCFVVIVVVVFVVVIVIAVVALIVGEAFTEIKLTKKPP